jgi:hypothetical protein
MSGPSPSTTPDPTTDQFIQGIQPAFRDRVGTTALEVMFGSAGATLSSGS